MVMTKWIFKAKLLRLFSGFNVYSNSCLNYAILCNSSTVVRYIIAHRITSTKKARLLDENALIHHHILQKYLAASGKGDTKIKNMPRNCLFCRIADGKVVDTELIYSNEEYVAFKDHRPVAEHHYLIVPKVHFGKISTLNKENIKMVQKMEDIGKEILANRVGTPDVMEDAVFGFHWPLCVVGHLHMHVIYPASSMSCCNRNIIFSKKLSFGTVDMALELLSKRS